MSRFDIFPDRKKTICYKQGFREEYGISEDTLALFIADMDFLSPEAAIKAVHDAAKVGTFGYAGEKNCYFSALSAWYEKRHQLKLEKEWVVRTPGVVTALAFSVRTFSEKGDGVGTFTPVYPPFFSVVRQNERRLIDVPLLLDEDQRFQIDFDLLEKKIKESRMKVFILCNPHNPGGRIWSREELRRMDELFARYGVVVVSDEIHHDFVFPGHEHVCYLNVSEEAKSRCVVCTAPSKTFNVAGLCMSNIFIADPKLREAFQKELQGCAVHASNIIGLDVTRACYEEGEAWLTELLEYLEGNMRLVREGVRSMKAARFMEMDGTYLPWIDLRELSLDHETLHKRLLKEAKLWLSSGHDFGADGFVRMNIGSPRSVIQEAVDRLVSWEAAL